MNKLILFYGTPDKIVVPTYGKGEEKHDYGQGFYLNILLISDILI